MAGRLSTSTRRRLRWRRIVDRSTLQRHPVSLARQRAGIAILAALALGFAWYAIATRDEAVRRRAVEFLSEATSGDVEVRRAHFKLFGGTTLEGVRVSVPFDAALDASAVAPEAREIFSAASVQLVHNTWRLLFGSLRVEHIIATKPKIVLVHNVDTGMRNWQLLSRDGATGAERHRRFPRPKITLRSAIAEVVSVHKDGRHEARTEELDVDVRPHPQLETAFLIEVRRFTAPAERTTVIFDPGERLVTNTPYVDARTIRLQLPKPAQQFFDRIALEGEVKLTRMIYDPLAPEDRDTVIALRRVRCAVPLSMLGTGEWPVPPEGGPGTATQAVDGERSEGDGASGAAALGLIAMTDVRGDLTLRGHRIELDVSGLVNGARCRVDGFLDGVDDSLDRTGFELHIQGEGIPAPEGEVRERLLTDAHAPGYLRKFLQDYDPHGGFDLDVDLSRTSGEGEKVHVSGALRPQGVSARCRWFTYPVHEIRGVVRFASGRVFLEDVHGRHGGATIVANGTIDQRTRCAAVQVDIEGTSVQLDNDLFEPLSERYKSLWRRFDPAGAAAITVSVRRDGAAEGEPRPPWDTTVRADLDDARICFRAYPYPLEAVHGRVEIGRNRISFSGLTGHRGDATLRIDGYADMSAPEDPRLELHIDAKSMQLDDTLAKALPADGRAVLAQFQPAGRVDLEGTVRRASKREGLVYDLRARLHDATLCYLHFPYRIHGVNAEVAIRPDNISILRVEGRHGTAVLSANGTVRRLSAEGDFVAELALDFERVALDQELYEALPGALKDVWDLLEPEGSVRARTFLHYAVEGGRRHQRHRTEIQASDGNLCFKGFPLPLSSVSADVLVRDREVEIRSLEADAGGGRIALSGQIDVTEPGRRGTLRLRASGMQFDKALIACFPSPLRKWLETIRPRGRFDLVLDPLQFDLGGGGTGTLALMNRSAASQREWRSTPRQRPRGLKRAALRDSSDQELWSTGWGSDTQTSVLQERPRWSFSGRLGLTGAGGKLGFDLRNVTGEIAGSGSVDTGGTMKLDARAELSEGVLGGWHLENVSAGIATGQDGRSIQVQDVSAEAYGGAVEATADVRLPLGRKPPTYRLSVTVRDVQLGRYMERHSKTGKAPKSEIAGSVYGNLVMRGRGGERPEREGVGEVFVRDAQVWKLPIVFALFQVLNLTPDENVFHDGWLKYSLSQDQLTFRQIDLQGKALSFIGGGRMDLRSRRLDLRLLAGSPVRIHVPFLTDLLQEASRELMEIRVVGTLDDPRMVPQPLRSLTEALRTLFPEPAARRADGASAGPARDVTGSGRGG